VSYSPKTNWKDLPDTSTPILSADLIRIETGIATVDANTTAETARAQAAEAAEATARANSDALFIPLTQKGSTSGVATLDSGTKIPVGQVPDLSATYALVAEPLAAKKASNLSDLASASTARTNLSVPPNARQVIAGAGLTGGGDLSADRTLTVAYGSSAGTAAQGNDTRIPTTAPTSKGQVLSATGSGATAWQAPRTIDARDYLTCDGSTDDSSALSTLITALQAATAGYPTPTVIEFPASSVKLWANQLPIIDPSIVTLRGVGCGYTTLDFTSAAFSGTAIRLQLATANAKSRRIVAVQGLLLNGSRTRGGTVDAISLGGSGVYGNALRFADVQISGFRDQVIYGTNAYLNVFDGCILDHCTRYAIDFSSTITNAGENEIFDNSVISNGEIGLHLNPSSVAPKFTFKTTSFDFMDKAMDRAGLAGSVDFIGCHFEGNYRQLTDLVLNSTTTATSATANFQAIDVGKRIADITGQTSIPANVTIASVTNSTTIVLSSAATASATITANIASNYYINDNVQGIVSDWGASWHGGEIWPSWDSTVRNGFGGINGAITTGISRYKLSGVAINTSATSTSKYLFNDSSTFGGNGIQSREPNVFDISGISYIGAVSTSYLATWPLWLADKSSKVYLVHTDFPLQIPTPVSKDWTLKQPQYWESMPRLLARDLFTPTSGVMYLVRLGMPDAGWAQLVSANQRWFIEVGAAGSGLTESRITFYRGMVSSNGPKDDTNLVSVYNSNNQTTLTGSAMNKFTNNQAEKASPWNEVWLGVLFIGSGMPTIWGINYGTARPGLYDTTNGHLQAAKLTGQSSSPSSITRSNLVATEFVPYLAVQPTMS
jgi:hypothetical protein